MADTELSSKLYEKASAEQDKFRAWLVDQPPADILNHAVEYAVREDILMEIGALELPDDQARALLVIHQEVGRSRPKLDGLHPQLPLRVQKVLEWIHPVVDVHRGQLFSANCCHVSPPFGNCIRTGLCCCNCYNTL